MAEEKRHELRLCHLQFLPIAIEFLHQMTRDTLSAWLPIDVVELMWIGLKIVKLEVINVGIVGNVARIPHPTIASILASALNLLVFVLLQGPFTTLSVEVNELITIGTDALLLACQMPCRVVVVMIVKGFTPY